MSDLLRLKRFRPARPDDTDHIVELLVPLFQKVGTVYGIPPDAESIIATVLRTIERGICLVGKHGCAGGVIRPYVWNSQARLGVIVFWNYTAPSGIHVFEAIREAFRQHGATHLNCASHFPDNRIGQFYGGQAVFPAEVNYIGKILHPAENGLNKGLATMNTHSDTTTPEQSCQL